MLMYPYADDVDKYLTSALPPSHGRPKSNTWVFRLSCEVGFTVFGYLCCSNIIGELRMCKG